MSNADNRFVKAKTVKPYFLMIVELLCFVEEKHTIIDIIFNKDILLWNG